MRIQQHFLVTLLMTFALFSCDEYIDGEGPVITRNLNIPDFTSIGVAGNDYVYLEKGSPASVRVTGQANLIDLLSQSVYNGHWNIRLINDYNKRDKLSFHIVMPELEGISVTGSGEVFSNDLFEAQMFQASVTGSGKMSVRVSSEEFYSDITGSGEIDVAGDTNEENITISGSGDFRGLGFKANQSDIFISGSGSARVHVEEYLEVNITGSGQVRYLGDPETAIRITGSGSVRRE